MKLTVGGKKFGEVTDEAIKVAPVRESVVRDLAADALVKMLCSHRWRIEDIDRFKDALKGRGSERLAKPAPSQAKARPRK